MKPTKGDLEKAEAIWMRLSKEDGGYLLESVWKPAIAQALAEARAEAVKSFVESSNIRNLLIVFSNIERGCQCPHHVRYSKHACPCTLRCLELDDAIRDLEKLKHSLTGEEGK